MVNMETQAKTTSLPSGETPTRQHLLQKNRKTFITNGKEYEILRFPFPVGLDLKRTICATEALKAEGLEMLTYKKTQEITDNPESNAAFKEKLKPGEWAYIRDKYTESGAHAAYLIHAKVQEALYIGDCWDDCLSPVVILEKTGSEAATTQSGQAEAGQLLRTSEQQE